MTVADVVSPDQVELAEKTNGHAPEQPKKSKAALKAERRAKQGNFQLGWFTFIHKANEQDKKFEKSSLKYVLTFQVILKHRLGKFFLTFA